MPGHDQQTGAMRVVLLIGCVFVVLAFLVLSSLLLSRIVLAGTKSLVEDGLDPSITSVEQEYVDRVPAVWMRADPKRRTRFHRRPDCKQLKKPPARGEHLPLVAVDLENVYVRPCRTCYPDAPHIKVLRRYCSICHSPYACEHNGGIQIVDRGGRHYWVWPDSNQMPFYRRKTS